MKLDKILSVDNVAEHLSENELRDVANKVVATYRIDKDSKEEWSDLTEKALKLVRQEEEKKSFPFEGAANIKFPLSTKTVLEIGARLSSEVVKNNKIAQYAVVGADPDSSKLLRSHRLEKFHNYQLMHKQVNWELDTDKIAHMAPMVGIAFRKTYYDFQNECPRSDFISHEDIFINDNVSCLEEAPRITEKVYKTKNDIVSNMRAGLYMDVDLGKMQPEDGEQCEDVDAPTVLLEQHRLLDLDGDGYEEPYIVLIHKDSEQVLRIMPRFDAKDVKYNDEGEVEYIKAEQYYTDFQGFISIEGKYWPKGFAQLLYPINSAVNTIMNQLIDAGTLSNNTSGFISDMVRIPGGELEFELGEFKKVEVLGDGRLADYVYQAPTNEPSPSLFQLMGVLIEASRDLASLTDVLLGKGNTQNVPATTILTMEKQGLTVYNSIQRRLYRAFKKEFEKQFKLNRKYVDKDYYETVVDRPVELMEKDGEVIVADFEDEQIDVVPIFNSEMATERMNLAKASILMGEGTGMPLPGVDPVAVTRLILETLDLADREDLLAKEDPNAPIAPEVLETFAKIDKFNAEAKRAQSEAELAAVKLELDAKKVEMQAERDAAWIAESQHRSAKAIMDAENNARKVDIAGAKAADETVLEEFRSVMNAESERIKANAAAKKADIDEEKIKQDVRNNKATTSVDRPSSDATPSEET